MFLNGISKYSRFTGLNEYTCLLAEAMFCDLECFKYLLDLYEKVKPTLEELIKSGEVNVKFTRVKPILFPFMVTGDRYNMGTNLLHIYLKREESISSLECLGKCSVFDQLLNDRDYFYGSPLSMAILLEKITLAERMVELGALIDLIDSKSSPIGQAVLGGHGNLVKKMLQIGMVFLAFVSKMSVSYHLEMV